MENEKIKFAVIISRYKDMWVFCKHKQRDTRRSRRPILPKKICKLLIEMEKPWNLEMTQAMD
ncbi:hypothetical protein NSB27_21525 [Murimonas intestini]|nr:hypothetical protein [Murimonas intestini]